MKLKRFYIVLVAILNVYYVGLWLYVFNGNTNQKDRISAFLENWRLFKDIDSLDFTLTILTLTSLVISYYKFNSKVKIVSIIINVLFLILLVWFHL